MQFNLVALLAVAAAGPIAANPVAQPEPVDALEAPEVVERAAPSVTVSAPLPSLSLPPPFPARPDNITAKCTKVDSNTWEVTSDWIGETAILPFCEKMLRMVSRFHGCPNVKVHECIVNPTTGNLYWGPYKHGGDCNGGKIESAWWETTGNTIGELDCPW